MAPPILILRDIYLTFGGSPLLEGAEFSVSENDRLCLVGRNGSGKSTLLKIAAGMVDFDKGERFVQPGITIRYLSQEPDLTGFDTTLAYVEAGLTEGDDHYRARYLLEQLGLSGEENPENLSGGEARRCALARVLAPQPDILLLDEPTNHLDLPAIEWLESELRSMRSALILISHDKRFLTNLSRSTLWLNLCKTKRMNRTFDHFEGWRDELMDQEEAARKELNKKIAVETDWLRQGVKARRTRNEGRVRALFALRDQRREQRTIVGQVSMSTTQGQSSGKQVIEAKNISKTYNGQTIVAPISVRVLRGDRIGIVGPNGAGKTTLLNMLTGALAPDEGSVKLGTNLTMVSLDQRRESLDPETSLSDALTGGHGDTISVGGEPKHVIGYMKDFLFAPEQARTALSALSGGERGRVMLARAFAKQSNLLVLDEPTNDLDLETLDLLQELLADYKGTVILVSHDRDFLDCVVTSVIASDGGGEWAEYVGGYGDMISQRKAQAKALTGEKSSKTKAGGEAKSKSVNKGKLSFKDKHALEKLPEQMAALMIQIGKLQETISDPELFTKYPDKFEQALQGLNKAQSELEAAEEAWVELELKREELEAS